MSNDASHMTNHSINREDDTVYSQYQLAVGIIPKHYIWQANDLVV